MNDIENRVAVISGASSGIGEATALRLAEGGAKVALLARRTDRVEETASRIADKGGTALALTVDVTDADSVRRAAERVRSDFGPADLVVNNAGVMLPSALEDRRFAETERQIDVNVKGLMTVVDAFLPQLTDAAESSGRADLVNISSIAAQNLFEKFSVYSGTKAFVTHMSKTLRAELGVKGVRVSAVEPGLVSTELAGRVTVPEIRDWLEPMFESIETLTPEDVAETIAFLASLPNRVNLQQVTVMPTGQPG
ncbi:SDR family oxidoreductase [Salininema proteolyticum]|uniref:SDR family oxidoreductase n=1 Tax=Salininema proteolyticum TaxID=1607685 RepID=A0ABV8U0N7_9ACTN